MRLGTGFDIAAVPGVVGVPTGPAVRGTPTTGVNSQPTLPTHQTGDLLVVVVGRNAGDNPTFTSGWTKLITGSNASGGGFNVYWKVAASSSETFSQSTTPYTWWAASFQTATTIATTAIISSTSATPSFRTITTTAPNSIVVDLIVSSGTTITSLTTPAADTMSAMLDGSAAAGTPQYLTVGYRTVAAQGATGTQTGAISTVAVFISEVMAIK